MVRQVLDRRGDCLAVIYVSLAGSSIFAQANAASRQFLMPQTAGSERGRRSSRVLVHLALAVSGQKSDGSHVSGAAETILVNRHGARIRSTVPLEPRMEVRVAMLAPYKWRVGQVVWADSHESEYGIELHRPENFWGIYFPPEDWELGVPPVTVYGDQPRSATQPRSAPEEPAETSSEPQPLHIPEGGTIAILRGIASNGMPFQERDLILPAGDRHATMLIGPMVELGAKLGVILSKNCVEDAVVTAVSHSREFDRWRIWMEFSRVLLISRHSS